MAVPSGPSFNCRQSSLSAWRMRDSNSRPPACKAGALPTELIPHIKIRQPPAFPGRLQPSIIGRFGLNHRVRDGYGCFPKTHRHRKYFVVSQTATLTGFACSRSGLSPYASRKRPSLMNVSIQRSVPFLPAQFSLTTEQ